MAVVDETLQVIRFQAEEGAADVLLRTVAAESKICLSKVIYLEALQYFRDDGFGIVAMLHHVRNRVDALQICFEFINALVCGFRQWLQDETTRTDAMEVGTAEHAEANTLDGVCSET